MRKSRPKKRILLPDPKYKDPYVTRFVNNLMFSGKKNLAFKIFYDSLEIVGDKFKSEGKTPLEIFKQAVDDKTRSCWEVIKKSGFVITAARLVLF